MFDQELVTNSISLFRSLLIFGICVPLAIFLGYLLATPLDYSTFMLVGVVFFVLTVPILLRWHHFLVFICWNTSMVVPAVVGGPPFWLALSGLSLVIGVLQRALNKNIKLLNVPSLTWPLIFLAVVILVTAKVTGGIGFGAMGESVGGGKRYLTLLGGIIGYFAMTSQRLPAKGALLMASLFFLGALTSAVGNMAPYVNPSLYFLFSIFPVEKAGLAAIGNEIILSNTEMVRFNGLTVACTGIFYALLARHGIKGVVDLGRGWSFLPIRFHDGLDVNQPWRLIFFVSAVAISLFGGFRSFLVIMILTLASQFFFEGAFKTRLLPILLLIGVLLAAALLPVIDKLPLSVQRALSVLPVEVDPIAKYDAEASSLWRLEMWARVLPEVPKYFFLGKGYGVNSREMEMVSDLLKSGQGDSLDVAILAGDYHNGPLSVNIPFGLFGALGFVWFLVASLRVLYRNYRYGDVAFQNLNTFLLAYFVAQTVFFFAVFGGFGYSMLIFVGAIGLSVSVNGGVAKPAVLKLGETASEQQELAMHAG